MKMRKLLATGVAASVAVTSLATVASAAEQTFDMAVSSAYSGTNAVNYGVVFGDAVGTSATQDSMQLVQFTFNGWDDPNHLWFNAGDSWTLTVKGTKVDEKGNETAITKDYKILKKTLPVEKYVQDDAGNWVLDIVEEEGYFLIVLKDDVVAYQDGEFAPSFFTTIEEMKVSFNVQCGTDLESAYNALNNQNYSFDVQDVIVRDWDTTEGTNPVWYGGVESTNKGFLDTAMAADNGAAALIGYGLTNGGYSAGYGVFVDPVIKPAFTLNSNYPFMAVTGSGVLMRQDIYVLSYSDAWTAINGGITGGVLDGDQTYNDDTLLGTNPEEFAGLASQVADFFNKQTNGTIKFTFTAESSAAGGNGWLNGGVPSTQVGIKDVASAWDDDDFALFFNYNQTGSLQAITSVDTTTGEVTFDISEVLDELGGQTKGVIDNIYYGLTKGINYNDGKGLGLYVKTITLAYDEDAAADEDIEDEEVEDDAEDDVEDDVEIDDDVEDDADDVEDDANVEGEVDAPVVEDDDANPETGVALAVVPALVAAAAVVVSKKRK